MTMNTIKYVLFISIFALFCLSCSDEGDQFSEGEFASTMDFSNLKIGQKSYFTCYSSTCAEYRSNIQWKKDTLILEVIAQDGGTFRFQETYTQYSESFNNGELPSPIETNVIFKDDYLLLPDRQNSNFFWFYGNDTLQLQPMNTVSLVQEDCGLLLNRESFIGNDIGIVSSFRVDDIEIENKIAVSCIPGFLGDIDAYLIYEDESLNASHVVFSDDTVLGWIQLDM